jgi:glycosyltransferase involved in cell wall biosynthesis
MLVIIEALGINQPGGGRTAVLNTILALTEIATDTRFIVYLTRFEPILANLPHLQQRIISTSNRFLARLILLWVLPYVTHNEKVDLVHFTKNLAVGFLKCPNIITLFDLTTVRFPDTQTWFDRLYWRWIEPISLKHAIKIITISKDVANDLIELYHIPQQNIRVIKLASDDRFKLQVEPKSILQIRETYQLPTEFVFFLGILAKKKNLKTLILSMDILRKHGYNYHLVIAGRPYLQSDASGELDLIEKLELQHLVHYIGPVLDDELPSLYAAASAYLLPSLHEGFGIPCWEAMAVGLPVVASKRGALPEIIGDAGLLIDDPLDANAWAEAIIRVLQDKELRTSLIERGYNRIADRTWKTVAAETLKVYEEVCGS